MGIVRTGLLALSALGISHGLPAFAQDVSSEAVEGEARAETLVVPFDPPIGTPLRYAMTFEKKGARGSGPVTMEQELSFKRIETGYLLTLTHSVVVAGDFRGDLTDPRILNAMPAGIRPFIMPLTIELDPSGEMVRMHDWDEVKKALADLPRTIAVMEGDAPDSAASKVVERVMAPMLNASAEEAPALIIRGWPDVLGYGGLAMEEGEAYEAYAEGQDELALGTVDGTGVLTLTRTGNGHFKLSQINTYDPESLAQMTRLVQQSFAEAGGPAPKEIPANDPSKVRMVDEIDYTFDGTTGLPISTTKRRIVSAQGEGVGGQVTTIERIGQ